MDIYLRITDQEDEYIRAEFPIAWKPGKNRNNWEVKQDIVFNAIQKQIEDTHSNFPIVTTNEDIRNFIIAPNCIIGFIRQFKPETGVVVCSIKKGKYNIPLEEMQMSFNSIADIDDNKIITKMSIIAGVPLLKGHSCYDKIEEGNNND